jgi:hypothetical protein
MIDTSEAKKLDPDTAALLHSMYKVQFPNIIEIILEQNKASGIGDSGCR